MSAAMVLPCSTPTLSNAGPNPHASESEGHAAYAARLKTELKITASFKPPAQEGGPWKVRAKFSQAAGRQLSRRRGVDSTFKGAGPAMSEVGGWASRCLRECDNDSNAGGYGCGVSVASVTAASRTGGASVRPGGRLAGGMRPRRSTTTTGGRFLSVKKVGSALGGHGG